MLAFPASPDRPGGPSELYDLAADPGGTRNLAPSFPDIVTRMTTQLRDWQRSVERSLSGADYR